jgi:hypothetical protein
VLFSYSFFSASNSPELHHHQKRIPFPKYRQLLRNHAWGQRTSIGQALIINTIINDRLHDIALLLVVIGT